MEGGEEKESIGSDGAIASGSKEKDDEVMQMEKEVEGKEDEDAVEEGEMDVDSKNLKRKEEDESEQPELNKKQKVSNGEERVVVPQAPPKRPQGAYFLFMGSVRGEIKKKLQAESRCSVANISKECGILWKALSEEEKAKYEEEAKSLKFEYEKKLKVYKESKKNAWEEESRSASALDLPLARVTAIMKKDPDMSQKRISKEAAALVTKSTELFLEYLAENVTKYREPGQKQSKTINYVHLRNFLMHGPKELDFLDVKDFPVHEKASTKTLEGSKRLTAPAQANKISSYFGK